MMNELELIESVLAQVEDATLFTRVRVLSLALAKETEVLAKEEFVSELIRIRFALMRINGVLMSENRTDHILLMAQQLVDERLREYAPEAE
jgi:hypothetical protein